MDLQKHALNAADAPAIASISEILDEDGAILQVAHGTSMLPLLKSDRNLVRIEAVQGRCAPGDVVLFMHTDTRCVLHRVVRVHEKSYTICGDNCIGMEEGIVQEQIIGRMTAFVRDTERGKGQPLRWVSIQAPWYRAYSVLMVCCLHPRRLLMKVYCGVKSRARKALKALLNKEG